MKKKILFFLIYCFTTIGYTQIPTNLNGWYPNAQVETIVSDANYIYLGGGFTDMIKEGTSGTFNRGTVIQTTGNGDVVTGFPKINDTGGIGVAIAIPDGNGGWYIGGIFTQVGGVTRNRIAHINPDKSLDITWNPNANGIVNTLVLSGTDLYVGGNFTSIGGQSRNRIAKLSTTGAGDADVTWNPNANSIVNTLVLSGTDLYVGGNFTSIGGQSRNRIAKLSTTGAGNADTTWDPNANSIVSTLALSGADLYAGEVLQLLEDKVETELPNSVPQVQVLLMPLGIQMQMVL